ncbi:9306_t:CDS:2 [Rhizophagus irregularis]|nr:9306_t:CDS:2 [Rhizophagus irregularis]
MSNNLHKSESLSSNTNCNNNLPNYNNPPKYRRTQSDFYSTQPGSTSNSRVKSVRRSTTGSFYDKSSTTLFWDLVGRENYTTSLNNSPVLCNSSTPTEEDYFGIATYFVNKIGSWSWRSKLSPRTVPTMIPKSGDNSINLLTTKFKGLRSSPTSITSMFLGSLDKNTQKNSTPSVPPQEPEPNKSLMTPIELHGRKADTEPIRQRLPRRVRLAPSWNLLYSLDQDGTSMTTMYHKVKDKGPLILVIKDMDEQVFGAFVSEPLKQRPSYYGSGECFLWKYVNEGETLPPKVKFYMWTGRNEYMILSEHDYLAIGGGDGRVGLWMDSDLERGSSARCDTFDNEVLSSTPEFICMGFEVWGFN